MKFNFKSTRPVASKTLPAADKAIKFLESIPDGDLIDIRELASGTGVSTSHLHEVSHQFLDYRHIVKGKGWFGNKRTIAALKKQFA